MRALAIGIMTALISIAAPQAHAASACPGVEDLPVVGGEPLSDLDDLIDRTVTGSDGQRVGTVWDVTLDRCRSPQDIILAESDGSRKVAIPIDRIRTVTNDNRVELSGLSAADVHALPAYRGSAALTSLARGRP
ncbi:PRC-barrel domain-containing protein [Azospirillum sp. sgz302134]